MEPKYKSIKLPSEIDLKYIDNLANYLKNIELSFKIPENGDIVHNIYEGGFKIWECTLDLLDFLDSSKDIDLKNKNILDLGCGQGLLGIYALKKEARCVLFQDFNLEVLKYFTWNNIKMNFPEDEIFIKTKFISGDWSEFDKNLKSQKFDIFNEKLQKNDIVPDEFDLIFMSEVIYQKENYEKIANIIQKTLKPKQGICILSTKYYYFGVGGSLPDFLDFISKKFPDLKVIEEKELNTKKSNKRALVLLKKT